MTFRRATLRSCTLLLLLVSVGCDTPSGELAESATLELHFIDVGEGDAILMRLPSGQAVVYDGGKDRRAMLAALQAAGVQSVDLIIASHSHSDHVGGLSRLVRHYQPTFVMENGLPHTTRRYHEFIAAVASSSATLLAPTRRTLAFGDVSLHIAPPPLKPEWGHNDNSIGVIVEYGAFRASLLGDAEPALHDWWLKNHGSIFRQVTVHKASHHGSRKGDTVEMLQRLRPGIVVVSTEAGSRYPHAEMVEKYRNIGAGLLQTDVHGTISIYASADGAVEVRTARCDADTSLVATPRTLTAGLLTIAGFRRDHGILEPARWIPVKHDVSAIEDHESIKAGKVNSVC
jgi:competence protein ComEC